MNAYCKQGDVIITSEVSNPPHPLYLASHFGQSLCWGRRIDGHEGRTSAATASSARAALDGRIVSERSANALFVIQRCVCIAPCACVASTSPGDLKRQQQNSGMHTVIYLLRISTHTRDQHRHFFLCPLWWRVCTGVCSCVLSNRCKDVVNCWCLSGSKSPELCQESGSEGSHAVISPKVTLPPQPVHQEPTTAAKS